MTIAACTGDTWHVAWHFLAARHADRALDLMQDRVVTGNSHVFVANAHYVFGDLRAWGWIALIAGALQLLAAAGVLAGSQLARRFAVAVVGLNGMAQMLFIPAYPFWSLTIIAMDVVALWGYAPMAATRTWRLSAAMRDRPQLAGIVISESSPRS